MAWQRRIFRGNKAWVRVAARGALDLDDRGLCRLRYKLADARDYTVRPADLSRLPPAEPSHATLRAYLAGAKDDLPGLGLVLCHGPHQAEVAGQIPEPAGDALPRSELGRRFIASTLRQPGGTFEVVSELPGPPEPAAQVGSWRGPADEAEAALLARAQRIADEAGAATSPD